MTKDSKLSKLTCSFSLTIIFIILSTFKSDYASKSQDGWDEQIASSKYDFKVNSIVMDDISGLIWVVTDDYSSSTDYLQVITVDSETGDTGIQQTFGKYGSTGSAFITSEGDQIFFPTKDGDIESITPYGKVGWTYFYDDISYSGKSAITPRDIVITPGDGYIVAIKYGAKEGEIVWNITITDVSFDSIGPLTLSGDNLYFCSYMNPFYVFIIDAQTGKLLNKKYFPIANDDEYVNKLAVDKINQIIYFTDNWDDYFNDGPYLYALQDVTLERAWNVTLQGTGARKGRTVCGNPMITPGGKIAVLCAVKGRKLFRTLYVVNPTSLDVQFVDFEMKDGSCEDPTLLNDTMVAVQCSYGAYPNEILGFDVARLEMSTIVTLDRVSDKFKLFPISDSSGCLYYMYQDTSSSYSQYLYLVKKCGF